MIITEEKPEMLLRKNLELMEEILNKENLRTAYETVLKNKGCAGVDGMTVEQLKEHLCENWKQIKQELLEGRYRPKPVKRVEIAKAGGGIRQLGIPTVTDRYIQQAVHQVLQKYIDPSFSESSYGFRPGRSAIDAIRESKKYVEEGNKGVVDIDMEKFFDRVNHDKLMSEMYKRISDVRVLKLIRSYLNAGVIQRGMFEETKEGTPQGGPLSPLLSNIVLDLLDKELEKRGHKFVRYADDCNIYVRTKKAGERVMKSVTDYIERKLKLKVNQEKSAVGEVQERKFLGFVLKEMKGKLKIGISKPSLERVKERIREMTRRTRGISMEDVLLQLRSYLGGWVGYYGHVEIPSVMEDLNKYIRRRLRCYQLNLWGKGSGTFKALKAMNRIDHAARMVAWSSKGEWRTSAQQIVQTALNNKYLERQGFVPLRIRS